jgi:hypothetical protein
MMTFAGVSPIVRVPAGPISLLSAIGRDCVGALQFLPDGAAPDAAGAINARGASDQDIARILGNLASHPLGVGPDQEFRISLAGVQEKTALLYWKNKWHVPHGTTATTHIIKPQIGRLPNGIDLTNSVENEYLCLQLVAALGLPVAKSRIVDFAGRRVLAIERFDRTWTRDGRLLRLPQEDCCHAFCSARPQIRIRRRPRRPQNLGFSQRQRHTRARPGGVFQSADRVLAVGGNGWPHQEFQHPPLARRTVRADAALRHHLGAAESRSQADHAKRNETRHGDRQ